MSSKKSIQAAIESALKKSAIPRNMPMLPRQHMALKGLVTTYKREAWKPKPNFNMMFRVTKKIRKLKGGKKK